MSPGGCSGRGRGKLGRMTHGETGIFSYGVGSTVGRGWVGTEGATLVATPLTTADTRSDSAADAARPRRIMGVLPMGQVVAPA